MLKTIFSKTLFEKRWGLLWWSLAMFSITIFIVVLFPTFKNSFGVALQDVPDSLKSVLGQASDYQHIQGFLELQVFMQMIFLTFIYGIILFTGLIAGEEGDGTLLTLLAHPVSRSKVYFQKLLAGAIMVGVVSLAMAFGVMVGVALIGESVSVIGVLQVTFVQWLVAMVLSLVGYSAGAITGRRGVAGSFAGIYAFATYLVSSLVGTVTALKFANNLSPFKYFNNTHILYVGLDFKNIVVLGTACIILTVIGWAVFVKRDIYSR